MQIYPNNKGAIFQPAPLQVTKVKLLLKLALCSYPPFIQLSTTTQLTSQHGSQKSGRTRAERCSSGGIPRRQEVLDTAEGPSP